MLWRTIKQTVGQFFADGALEMGAAIAFYSALSLAPLLLLLVSVAGWLGNEGAIQREVLQQTEYLIGPNAAELVGFIMNQANEPEQGAATLLGFVLLLIGATTVFAELQTALNTIWGVRAKPGRTWLGWIRIRLLSLGLIVAFGFLLIVSLALSAAVSFVMSSVRTAAASELMWQLLVWASTLLLFTLAFAAIFRALPDVEIAWRDVWAGAALTAFMLATGKELIGLYLGRSGVSSSYGAAGSLIVLLLWIYYASLILLLGAEVTQALVRRRGKPIVPSDWAIRDRQDARRQ